MSSKQEVQDHINLLQAELDGNEYDLELMELDDGVGLHIKYLRAKSRNLRNMHGLKESIAIIQKELVTHKKKL